MNIKNFRAGGKGNPDLIRESQTRRFKPVEIVDEVIRLDEDWRKLSHQLDQLNKELNQVEEENKKKRKANQDTSKELIISEELKAKISVLEQNTKACLKERDDKLYTIGNFVHDSVPVSNNEKDNLLIRTWGSNREKTEDLHHHHELLYMMDGYESEIGSMVAGHRGYYLKGFGVYLNQALINYGMQFLYSKGYNPVQTPFFMRKSVMSKVAALAEFEESLYNVASGGEEDCFLIATSEQPCCALHMNSTLNAKQLPIKYVGYSTCFRKEAGSYGKDVWGIFRVHQFEKIEQFVLCAPKDSWALHEEMIKVSEEFYQSLEIPYRVVSIVSGELNNAASKKYDLEAWFPTLGNYRELVSCSNCTDYQSRRLEIKFGSVKAEDGSPQYVHMLNSTLTATERTICCILENYQTPKGIKIPKVLLPYLLPFYGQLEDDVVPFVKGPPPVGKGAKGNLKAEKAGSSDVVPKDGPNKGAEQKPKGGEQKPKEGAKGGDQKPKGGEQKQGAKGGEQKPKEGAKGGEQKEAPKGKKE